MPTRTVLRWDQDKVTARVKAAMLRRLEIAGAGEIHAIRAELSGPSPSAPGRPPGARTGKLASSVQARVTQLSPTRLRLTIFTALHGIYLRSAKSARRRRPFAPSERLIERIRSLFGRHLR